MSNEEMSLIFFFISEFKQCRFEHHGQSKKSADISAAYIFIGMVIFSMLYYKYCQNIKRHDRLTKHLLLLITDLIIHFYLGTIQRSFKIL